MTVHPTICRFAAYVLVMSLPIFTGCGDDDTTDPGPGPADVSVTLTNFAPNSPAQGHYEFWIAFASLRQGPEMRHSEAASAGKFRIGGSGSPVTLAGAPMEFEVSLDDPNAQVSNGRILWQLAVDAFVTIEPDGDSDGSPRLPGIVAGSFLNREATLHVDTPDAIEVDLSGAAGSLQLATPTTPSAADETQGVWFSTAGGAAASLALPTLGGGVSWTYEAWVTHPSAGTASLGKFLSSNGADQDGPGPLGGTGYAFPGSDFPFGSAGTDLATSTVFVTLEPPNAADGPGPFFFQVLRAELAGAASGAPVAMTALPLGSPGGSVSVPRD